MLSNVNTMNGHMMKEDEDSSAAWAKECDVSQKFFHGSRTFTANAFRKNF